MFKLQFHHKNMNLDIYSSGLIYIIIIYKLHIRRSVLLTCFCFPQAGTLALHVWYQSGTLGSGCNPMSNWSDYNLVICKQTFARSLSGWPRAALSQCLHSFVFWKCQTMHVQVCDTVKVKQYYRVKDFNHINMWANPQTAH